MTVTEGISFEYLTPEPAVIDGISIRTPGEVVAVRVWSGELNLIVSPKTWEFLSDLTPESQLEALRDMAGS